MVFPPYFRASALNIDTLTKFYMLFLVTVFDQDLRLFCLSISRDFNTRMFFFFFSSVRCCCPCIGCLLDFMVKLLECLILLPMRFFKWITGSSQD